MAIIRIKFLHLASTTGQIKVPLLRGLTYQNLSDGRMVYNAFKLLVEVLPPEIIEVSWHIV